MNFPSALKVRDTDQDQQSYSPLEAFLTVESHCIAWPHMQQEVWEWGRVRANALALLFRILIQCKWDLAFVTSFNPNIVWEAMFKDSHIQGYCLTLGGLVQPGPTQWAFYTFSSLPPSPFPWGYADNRQVVSVLHPPAAAWADSPSPRGHHLSIAHQLGVWAYESRPSLGWNVDWLGLVPAAVSSCFVPMTLFCSGPPWKIIKTSGFYNLFTPSFVMVPMYVYYRCPICSWPSLYFGQLALRR